MKPTRNPNDQHVGQCKSAREASHTWQIDDVRSIGSSNAGPGGGFVAAETMRRGPSPDRVGFAEACGDGVLTFIREGL
jgi:hypothetical protein